MNSATTADSGSIDDGSADFLNSTAGMATIGVGGVAVGLLIFGGIFGAYKQSKARQKDAAETEDPTTEGENPVRKKSVPELKNEQNVLSTKTTKIVL